MTNDKRDSAIIEYSQETQDTLSRLRAEALQKLEADGGSNSEFSSCIMSLANSWVNAGGSEAGLFEAVALNTLGSTYKRRDLDRRVSSAFAKAEEDQGNYTTAPNDVRPALLRIANDLDSLDIPQSALPSARALVEIAAEVGTWAVDMSTRRLSERTGLTIATSAKHLRLLSDSSLIRRTVFNGQGKARTFEIDLDLDPGICLDNDPRPFAGNSLIWSSNGLGSTAEKIYTATRLCWTSVAEIHHLTGSTRRTIQAKLAVMQEHGLVVITGTGRGYRAVINLLADPTELLADASGAVEAAKQRHRQEREIYNHARNYPYEVQRTTEGFARRWRSDPITKLTYRLTPEGSQRIKDRDPSVDPCSPPEVLREYAPNSLQEVFVSLRIPQGDGGPFTADNMAVLDAQSRLREEIRGQLQEIEERESTGAPCDLSKFHDPTLPEVDPSQALTFVWDIEPGGGWESRVSSASFTRVRRPFGK
ncbi:hypothetical protein WG915_04915 [Corynebacterium sp. H128]|uniref:hypothetical protein n=1 Tax=Corynebacterium sp. H128 TaxID=3133427 RepID=UPI0030980A4C